MSLNHLLSNILKPWLKIRAWNLTLDSILYVGGQITAAAAAAFNAGITVGGGASIDYLTVTESASFYPSTTPTAGSVLTAVGDAGIAGWSQSINVSGSLAGASLNLSGITQMTLSGTFSNSDISTLYSVGKLLVSGASGTVLMPRYLWIEYLYDGSHAISGGGNNYLQWGSTNHGGGVVASSSMVGTLVWGATKNQLFNLLPVVYNPAGSAATSVVEGQPLYYSMAGSADFTMNSSTATATFVLVYDVIPGWT